MIARDWMIRLSGKGALHCWSLKHVTVYDSQSYRQVMFYSALLAPLSLLTSRLVDTNSFASEHT